MKTQQIGRAGELLVQYKLLKFGVDSSALTTDSGVDLVAYFPSKGEAVTIQVKTNEKAKPSGGLGAPALDWWLREDSPAQLVAVVNLDTDEAWLFTHKEYTGLAQQRSGGRLHLYMYANDDVNTTKRALKVDFAEYLLENKVIQMISRNPEDAA